MKQMMRKLNSSAGESIAEVLAAMLVIALGIVMLVSMVSSSGNMIRRSEQSYAENMDQFNALEVQASPAAAADPKPETAEISMKSTSGSDSYTGSITVWKAGQ
jgi:Tfp pilus assembly protein PilV